MGKKELKQGAMTKERLQDIMALRKSKEYDKIFEIYGQRIFRLAVSGKYKKQDIENLLEEGRFEDIYRKYGERTYNSYIYVMQQKDIYNETGSKPRSILNRVKNVFLHRIAPVALSASLLLPATAVGVVDHLITEEKKENAIEYAKEIEEYNSKINMYAEEVNSMNLNDTQIFMKVMNDMWNSIDGYATADNEVSGYLRLTLDSEGVGVCRNFADDVTAKLNAINPEYNARNVIVYMESGKYHLANIKRNIIEQNETVAEENSEEKVDNTEYFGNHMVTAVDIPDKNITLILDPTNPGIGVFKDGQIYMFSTDDGKGLETKPLGQLFQGLDNLLDMELTSLKSFLPCKYSLEELEELYGRDAQNEALKYLAALECQKDVQIASEFVPKATVNERDAIEETRKNIAEIQGKQNVKSQLEDNQEIK